MHSHIQGVTAQIANPYASLVLDNAAEIRRAAILRRSLLNAAANLEQDDSPEAVFVRGAWKQASEKDSRPKNSPPPKEASPSAPERIQPISFWA